jgi:hypothetical protein
MNLLSTQQTNGKDFFGYHVSDARQLNLEYEIPGANHQNIVTSQTALGYVLREVDLIAPMQSFLKPSEIPTRVPFINLSALHNRAFRGTGFVRSF